ncbi:MAG: class III poly(R)-hydroxyalkanoic acid synthase subunit PhaC [Rhodanobacteraceae bacterium]
MFGPLKMTPQALAEEAMRLQQKLGAGLKTLREVDDVTYGATDKEAVYSDGRLVLYRFRGEKPPTASVPLLVTYALVNRPYMVDLQHDRSLVKGLLAHGEDVYIIDWGYPDGSDRYLTLEDYIERFIGGCVEFLCAQHRLPSINVLGICQGGAFSLCYASLHPERVRNLITMVTPVDFHTPENMLSHWMRGVDTDLFVDTLGNVPADLMNWCYLTLKPVRLNQQKYIGLVDILDDKVELENFLRMEKWIFDSPDQAGEAFRQFIKDFYQGNKLIKGGLRIGDGDVALSNITVPVLNIFAEQDHLVPPSASRVLGDYVGTDDYTQLAFKGGHIGIYVSGRAQREVPPAIHDWLAARTR